MSEENKNWYDGLTEEQIQQLKDNTTVLCRCPEWMQEAFSEMPDEITGLRGVLPMDLYGYNGKCAIHTYFLHPDFSLPKKPEYEIYPVEVNSVGDYIVVNGENRTIRLSNAIYQKGFSGMQFEGQVDESMWFNGMRFLSDDGFTFGADEGITGRKMAVPVRVRWKV